MLVLRVPLAPGAPIRRMMLIGEDLHNELTSPEGDDEWEKRVGELMADLDHFVGGEHIHCKYLFLLSPARENVWEIRSVRDQPSIRVLGLFAKKDTFVATNFARRDALGGWESKAWKHVKLVARSTWRKIFSVYNPESFTNIHQLVSGAIDGKYVK